MAERGPERDSAKNGSSLESTIHLRECALGAIGQASNRILESWLRDVSRQTNGVAPSTIFGCAFLIGLPGTVVPARVVSASDEVPDISDHCMPSLKTRPSRAE